MPAPDDTLADALRERIILGEFAPGTRLSEASLADHLGVSRNTLREAFRVLAEQGLIEHVPHRGVSVASPAVADVIDIYRARRLIEPAALAAGSPLHPAVADMTAALERGEAALAARDWRALGTANMAFHEAIVALADSPRLGRLYRDIAAELRLAFLEIDSPEALHAPFVARNRSLLETFLAHGGEAAARQLHDYLVHSEQTVLGAYTRQRRG
ncbi:GntR family transcriptional regulator [Microbacterium sp. JZ31]|uniref:GntR family transcriptional regulator n=1 Tax=Microbacterium sp. JZ31 TaxID=1906274 RepID=UPI001931ECF7|nr:GntR family transcriptional regulator [Microbacterium sp. JZ31]